MEVKQEPDNFFIEECKLEIEEQFFPNEIDKKNWNDEKYNNQINAIIKNELISIKQENDVESRTENVQLTSKICQIVDGGYRNCHLVHTNDTKQSKTKIPAKQNHLKNWLLSGGILICKLCGNFYTRKFELFRHISMHHLVKKKHFYIGRPSYYKTKQIKSIKWKYQPNKTKKILSREVNIKSKIFTDKLQVPFIQIYNKLFCSNKLQCEICLELFTGKVNLVQHMRIHRGKKLLKCKVCFKFFTTKSSLNRHMHIHTNEKAFKCEICLKSFAVKGYFDQHMQIHTGEKPFRCDICSRCFIRRDQLKSHIRSHNGEKLFKCEICFKMFADKSYLVKHIKRIHSDEKPFQCHICLKSFSQQGTLGRHKRSHAGEKPFKCDICFKTFSKDYSTRHMLIHTGEKPFQCDICFKSFRQRGLLKQHMRYHTGENPSNVKLV